MPERRPAERAERGARSVCTNSRVRVIRCLVTLVLIGLSAAPVLAADRALIIGIGRYQQPGASLPGIDKDVAMMRDVTRQLGFRESDVKVLSDEQATLEGIRTAFRTWLREGVGPGDRVLIYFSGHGSQVKAARDTAEDDGLDEVWVPHDFGADGAGSRALVDDEVHRLLAAIPAGEVLVLLDSCHSGTATKARGFHPKFLWWPGMPAPTANTVPTSKRVAMLDRPGNKDAGGSGVVAVAAAADHEYAQATDRGSVFTQGVLKAVTDATRANAPLSMLRIRDVSTEEVARLTTPQTKHTPQIDGTAARFERDIRKRPGSDQGDNPPANLWETLDGVVAATPPDHLLDVSANAQTFKVRQRLTVTVSVPADGYLYLLNFGEGDDDVTLLFPNGRQTDNRVAAGTTTTVPPQAAPFALSAVLPSGTDRQRVMLVAVITPLPMAGEGVVPSGQALLAQWSLPQARSFIEVAASSNYHAGKVEVVVSK